MHAAAVLPLMTCLQLMCMPCNHGAALRSSRRSSSLLAHTGCLRRNMATRQQQQQPACPNPTCTSLTRLLPPPATGTNTTAFGFGASTSAGTAEGTAAAEGTTTGGFSFGSTAGGSESGAAEGQAGSGGLAWKPLAFGSAAAGASSAAAAGTSPFPTFGSSLGATDGGAAKAGFGGFGGFGASPFGTPASFGAAATPAGEGQGCGALPWHHPCGLEPLLHAARASSTPLAKARMATNCRMLVGAVPAGL
jgi:hypothetical protein